MFLSLAGKPYSSFFSCNVPHDEWGLRVKTLDAELAAHIDQAARQSNTLTILLSDHGNAYGDFTLLDQGREETYHPALFMIAPEKVQQMLGMSQGKMIVYVCKVCLVFAYQN